MASFQILLATLNGARFLQKQIDSLAIQDADEIHVLASDDGSDDTTLEILGRAKENWSKGSFEIIKGPGKGFAHNFRNLIEAPQTDADIVAFCDQDDVWMQDKCERTAAKLLGSGALPHVLSSRTVLIDKNDNEIGYAPIQRRAPSFRNAVLQNIAGGNTMVMNRSAFQLLRQTSDRIAPISHDRWLYMIVTGSGGLVEYSREPTIYYRQHEHNAIGMKKQPILKTQMWRLNRFMTGRVRAQTDTCLEKLESCRHLLTEDAVSVLDALKILHDGESIGSRLSALQRSGVYRNTLVGQLGLWVDCAFKLR